MADNTGQVAPAPMPQPQTPNTQTPPETPAPTQAAPSATPATPSVPTADTQKAEVKGANLPQHGSKTIMVVEDDAFLSNLLVTRLRGSGLNVIRAATGEEALNVLRTQEPPSLILLDIILPEKSGFEVLEEIQADPTLQKAPVIITSNLGQEADIEKGKKLGVVDYFIKAQTPIDELVGKVKAMVDKPSAK